MDIKNLIQKTLELIKVGEFNQALDQLNKFKNEDSNVFYLRGSIYLTLKKIDLAEENLKSAAKLDNTNPSIFHNLAVLYISKGDKEAAKLNYLKAININNNITSLCELASLYVEEKNYNDAQKYFETALQHDPNHKKANLGLGNLYMIKNDYYKGFKHTHKGTGLIRFNKTGIQII
tara:strand:+ start:1279 stop:1806 length:528 start_codon:yes stop_codon:yes gene_type:complete